MRPALSRVEIFKRIAALPPDRIPQAAHWAAVALKTGPEDHRARAASYADDPPEKYSREVLNDKPWTRRQRAFQALCLDALEGRGRRRFLLVGGTGTGKTHVTSRVALWVFDPRGSRRDIDGAYQGCKIIMTAPTAGTLAGTIYGELVAAGRHAAANHHMLPGWAPRKADRYMGASDRSVNWSEPGWSMEAITPRRTAEDDVAHSMSGRHHSGNQVILLEEGAGLAAGALASAEGLAVPENVLLIGTANPTSRRGPLYGLMRASPEAWKVFGVGQLDHPNVVYRDERIPGSISHETLEQKLRSSASFIRRGPASTTDLDLARMDFVYACPAADDPDELGPRDDGIPGHPAAEPYVFRPANAQVAGMHLDAWLEVDAAGLLFDVMRIRDLMIADKGVPDTSPDQVGVDCAATRPPVATPRWGPAARIALDAKESGEVIICGESVEVPWSGDNANAKGRAAAQHLLSAYGGPPVYVLDRPFGGEVGQALATLGAKVIYVAFGDSPVSRPLDLYGTVLNRRTEMATDAAAALHAGLVSLPYSDSVLRQMEATGQLVVAPARGDVKKLRPKSEVEQEFGGPVDKLDSVYLALTQSTYSWGVGGV